MSITIPFSQEPYCKVGTAFPTEFRNRFRIRAIDMKHIVNDWSLSREIRRVFADPPPLRG